MVKSLFGIRPDARRRSGRRGFCHAGRAGARPKSIAFRPEAQYLERRELLAAAAATRIFDFGPTLSSSPAFKLAPGYTPADVSTYSTARGYGWAETRFLYADDRWSPNADPMTRDFVYGFDSTFLVDLPRGVYDVTPVLGDQKAIRDAISVWAEGQPIAVNLSSSAGQFLRPTARVTVSDGQLNLRIADGGGVNRYFSINGLEIRPAGPSVSAGPDVNGDEGFTVTLNGLASGNGPFSYSWDFGDGTSAVGVSKPSHIYADNGTYRAMLTVTDAYGLSAQSTTNVAIRNLPPDVDIGATYAGAAGLPILFAATATDPGLDDQAAGLAYAWDFGDKAAGHGASSSHVYAAPGTYTATLTVTDKDGGRSTTTTTVRVDPPSIGVVLIDAGWLARRGAGPYLLDQASTTYVLMSDVRTAGTAFVVAAGDVTLDLNDHTIVYGDAPPTDVPNGGFEDGDGRNVPSWDLSGAPAASLSANTSYLWGSQVLRLTNFSTTQSISSDPIPIVLANHTYTATITPARGNYRTQVRLSVVDAETGEVLATGNSASVERGFSAVARFTPTTTRPVRLRVDVTPPAGAADSIDLDAASISASYDYGVIASRAWSGDVPGFNNLGIRSAAYDKSRQLVGDFTIKNGRVIQGRGNGFGGSPLYFRQLAGLVVDRVEAHASGDDTTTLDGSYLSKSAVIRDSTFRQRIVNVTNRMHGIAQIALGGTQADIRIENNRLFGVGQAGISVANTGGYHVAIRGNEIRQESVVTNGYGISLSAVTNFDILGNTIVTSNGRGIMLDGYSSRPLGNGAIRDNYVEVRERPNRENTAGVEARALRLRNNVDSMGTHRDVDISGNTFFAWAGAGEATKAYGVRISYVNKNGSMDDANVTLHGNHIKALVTTGDPSYGAQALSIDGVDPDINLRIWDNVLESNDTSLALAGSDGGDVYGVTLTGNTLRKSADGPARTYRGILAGYWIRQIHNVAILDTRLEGGATANITWAGSGIKEIAVG